MRLIGRAEDRLPIVPEEDLEESGSLSEPDSTFAQITKGRKRFLILAVFDFCFISLLWFFTVLLNDPGDGGDTAEHFAHEFNITSPTFIKDSLLDMEIFAAFRCLWLWLWYGLLLAVRWQMVAFSTCLTTLYSFIKIYYLSQHGGLQTSGVAFALTVFLLISGLILAWLELWLMPFRNVAAAAARRVQGAVNGLSDSSTSAGSASATAPVSTLGGVGGESEEDMAAFYSALEEDSVDGRRDDRSDQYYLDAAAEAMRMGRALLRQVEAWKGVNKRPLVRLSKDPTHGTVYYLRLELHYSLPEVFQVLYHGLPTSPAWNKNVIFIKIIKEISPAVELTYSCSAPALRGYVPSRDFVDVRVLERDSDSGEVWIASRSVSTALKPPTERCVRGVNGPTLWHLRPLGDSATAFQWIMNTHMKGKIPANLVERGMTGFLVDYAKAFEAQLAKIRAANS